MQDQSTPDLKRITSQLNSISSSPQEMSRNKKQYKHKNNCYTNISQQFSGECLKHMFSKSAGLV